LKLKNGGFWDQGGLNRKTGGVESASEMHKGRTAQGKRCGNRMALGAENEK